MDFTDGEARDRIPEPASPVPPFPMRYIWHTGPWHAIFDRQIELIQSDIRRAKAEDKLVIYLSCPISSRGGGYSSTNVDVAKHIERALLERWGEAFWILNPAQYQLESKAGSGLIDSHARELGIDLARLKSLDMPFGGDYMRMWTTVLVANDVAVGGRRVDASLVNTGQFFDAFYFIGPRDVQTFFMTEGETLTAGIQAYFARKFSFDADFRAWFDLPALAAAVSGAPPDPDAKDKEAAAHAKWVFQRVDFLRYYSLRASANFSLGSHDEWLIFKHVNDLRRTATINAGRFMVDGDVSEQLAGFFDGGQINPASTELALARGYSL